MELYNEVVDYTYTGLTGDGTTIFQIMTAIAVEGRQRIFVRFFNPSDKNMFVWTDNNELDATTGIGVPIPPKGSVVLYDIENNDWWCQFDAAVAPVTNLVIEHCYKYIV